MIKDSLLKKVFAMKCLDLSIEGKGVCKLDGLVVFVPSMLPGDEGDVEIDYKRNGQYFGKIKKLNVLSKDRIEPKCKVSSSCGGCVFQCLNYEAELKYKTKKVQEQLSKYAGIDIEVMPTIGMKNPEYYRNKVQVPFGSDRFGKVFYGFYKEGTHNIVARKECFIEDKRANVLLEKVTNIVNDLKIPAYKESTDSGVLRYAMIRTSYYKEQLMLVLVTREANFSNKELLFERIHDECEEVTTLTQNVNSQKTNVILGKRFYTIYGPGFIEDSLCGINFKISPESFYQTNPAMTEILYKTVMDFANLNKNDIVLDAYSGIGTIGLIAARSVKKVISVELVEEAVKDAVKNSKANAITNFEAWNDDATEFINRMAKRKEHLDVLFMDPPRKGSTEAFINAALSLEPKKIVYVSCNPLTLARDLKLLKSKYDVKKVQTVDEFGRSFHVESVVLLEKHNG